MSRGSPELARRVATVKRVVVSRAVLGILAETRLVRYVSRRALERALSVALIVMGTFILVWNRAAFTTTPGATSR